VIVHGRHSSWIRRPVWIGASLERLPAALDSIADAAASAVRASGIAFGSDDERAAFTETVVRAAFNQAGSPHADSPQADK
jgi:hypothetical protein